METQTEKVYVAMGNDLQDGIGTLDWVLKKWPPFAISIVILYADANMAKHIPVYTPFGKLPKSFMNDNMLDDLRKSEQVKIDKTLSAYIAFCGKVRYEILNIDKYDEPLQNIIVDLIRHHRITKLVMGFSFIKSSAGKSRNAVSGPFYVHRNKPDFCELFTIHEGKLVFLREENKEGIVENDQGNMLAKISRKNSVKDWLRGKMFQDSFGAEKSPLCSPSSSASNDSPNQWQKYAEEIENYFNLLVAQNADEVVEVEVDTLCNDVKELEVAENMTAAEKIEVLKMKIGKARDEILLHKRDTNANIERQLKAEWAISLSTRQAEELEARVSKEMSSRVEQTIDLEATKEELDEIRGAVDEKKRMLNSTLELHLELSNKLRSSEFSKSRVEIILKNAVEKRAEVVREIEGLRRQRDVIQRRIEFCREKEAIGNASSRLAELSFDYKEFTPEELRVATDNFSERSRLKSSGDWTNTYRGRIIATAVAIKSMAHLRMDDETFQTKMKLFCQARHPNIVAVLGFCSELQCIVFEYMHNGCLRDTLYSSYTSSGRRRTQGLNWNARIRIATEVCAGLCFLHQARPRPIVKGNLNPSKILLDRNNVAKIHGFRPCKFNDESDDIKSDIRPFGNLILQLLTGHNWAGLVEEATVMDRAALVGVLDETAGEWPLDLAMELGRIAIRCLSTTTNEDLRVGTIMRELDEVRKMADSLVTSGEYAVTVEDDSSMEDSRDVPRVFLCPIQQEVMMDPHLAADGFSYELEAIKEWFRRGHDTSPMTNLRLKHLHLTPNHTLRSLIQDWQNNTTTTFNS